MLKNEQFSPQFLFTEKKNLSEKKKPGFTLTNILFLSFSGEGNSLTSSCLDNLYKKSVNISRKIVIK